MPSKIELCCCTETILRDIADKKLYRKDVAKTIALALRSYEKTDWPAVNKAIIERWSPAAREYIFNLAWSGKCFQENKTSARREK